MVCFKDEVSELTISLFWVAVEQLVKQIIKDVKSMLFINVVVCVIGLPLTLKCLWSCGIWKTSASINHKSKIAIYSRMLNVPPQFYKHDVSCIPAFCQRKQREKINGFQHKSFINSKDLQIRLLSNINFSAVSCHKRFQSWRNCPLNLLVKITAPFIGFVSFYFLSTFCCSFVLKQKNQKFKTA